MAITRNYHGVCSVCGKPIAFGKTHNRCKSNLRKCGDSMWMQVKLEKLAAELQGKLARGVKHWHRRMGQEERDRMFPDMKGRD